METRINVGDPQAIKHWSHRLAVDSTRMMWWTRMTGEGENNICQEIVDLESNAGDTVQYDLSASLRGEGVTGDDPMKGKEEKQKYLIDEIKIDQIRHGVSAGGRMTRKRTLHDLRKVGKRRLAEWFAKFNDEMKFCYVSGVAGNGAVNQDAVYRLASFAGNAVEAPDADHILYGGAATSKATVAATDKMTADIVRKLATKAAMLNARNPLVADMKPVRVEDGEHFVLVMSPDQSYDLRTETGQAGWLEIQKATAQRGSSNPLFSGKEGMIDDVVLQKHSSVRRFTDYGAGGAVEAARAVFLGCQALAVAYGNANNNGTRVMWKEEEEDYGNQLNIVGGQILGCKKTRYKDKNSGVGTDFGVIAVDTAAKAAY